MPNHQTRFFPLAECHKLTHAVKNQLINSTNKEPGSSGRKMLCSPTSVTCHLQSFVRVSVMPLHFFFIYVYLYTFRETKLVWLSFTLLMQMLLGCNLMHRFIIST